jgi:hypothetical protein
MPMIRLDSSFIDIDGTDHLGVRHGQVAFIEGRRSSGLRRRLNGELVSFDHSGDGYRVVSLGPTQPVTT